MQLSPDPYLSAVTCPFGSWQLIPPIRGAPNCSHPFAAATLALLLCTFCLHCAIVHPSPHLKTKQTLLDEGLRSELDVEEVCRAFLDLARAWSRRLIELMYSDAGTGLRGCVLSVFIDWVFYLC